MTNKPNWQSELRDRLLEAADLGGDIYCVKAVDIATAFIQDLLDSKVKKIGEHGYRKNEPGWEKISTEVKFYGMGYNDGLSQAIIILKEE